MSSTKDKLLPLTIGSIGVVYGDIGTSPLYAFRESLHALGSAQPDVVFGLLSLIFWTLLIIVTLKYVFILLRADNHGEGGILALMTQAQHALGRGHPLILLLGMTGAALFYGDAIITPAISVLSAVEGLKLVTPSFQPYVVAISMGILIALFVVQYRGAAKVGVFFGPITLVWFLVLGAGGLSHISDHPDILLSVSPHYALHFMMNHGWASVIALGAVFLTVTGAEALYADLGHFGKKPIQLAWLFLVMPCLMLNYFGQGALVLANPEAMKSPFYMLYPDWAQLPVVILATVATVIASQAVITGAFSMTHQAMQLGIFPRLHVHYTSDQNIGQIYIPKINWLLLAGVLFLIQVFRSSDALASAYGIAVTGTMLITTFLLAVVMRRVWKKSLALTLLVITPLVTIEVIFFGANLTKLFHGGYIPVLFSIAVIFLMRTWVLGNNAMRQQLHTKSNDIKEVLAMIHHESPEVVGGTAVYINMNEDYAPMALIQNFRHNKIIHQQNILLSLEFVDDPHVPDHQRARYEVINRHFNRVVLRFGYMEPPHITRGLLLLDCPEFEWDSMGTTFFISHRHIIESSGFGMPVWRDRIFITLYNSGVTIGDYLHLPFSRVVEMGVRITV
jgi:KUP system potassium uptake protein